MADQVYLDALGRERAMFARSPQHYERVMMVDQELARLGFAADDDGVVRKLPPVERADEPAPKRVGRPRKETAVSVAPERAVED